ncbi:hypothetical protein BIV03_10535 [Curtobacterium sp. MCBA15_016]|nr:hypothetical protein BIV03_10535 [Curtobacterium sp. MCBA15_016]
MLRYALQHRSHGVATVDAGSLNGELAKAIVKFSAMTQMPCVVFADSDESGLIAVADLKGVAGAYPIEIIWINGQDGEGNPLPGAIEDMLLKFDEKLCERACDRVRPGTIGNTKQRLKQIKGSSGRFLAEELIHSYPSVSDWPTSVQELVRSVEITS